MWIARLIKVSAYKFVADAEIPEQDLKDEVERKRKEMEKEIAAKFLRTAQMEEEIERQKKNLETEISLGLRRFPH